VSVPQTSADPEPAETRDIETREGRVRVRVLGRGPAALFLHGVSAQSRSWLPVARALGTSGRPLTCWLPDLLGRGASAAHPELRYTLDDEVRRLRELVDVLVSSTRSHPPAQSESADGPESADAAESLNVASGGPPAVVVGHSQGAAIALAYAQKEPAVRGLVLSNPISADIRRPLVLSALDSRWVRHALARGFSPFSGLVGRVVLRRAGGPHFRVPPETSDAYAAPFRDPTRARTLMRILSDWRPADLASRMPSRELAVHVFAGAHDPRVPVEAARRLAERLDAGFTCVPNGGHVLPEQEPQLLADAIARLTEQLA